MKKTLLSLICIFIAATTCAQKLEVTAGAYTGLLSFSGKSAEATSAINSSATSFGSYSYTNNPYGNKMGTGFGFSAQGQLVGKGGFIIGLQTAYEQLKSKIDINQVNISNPLSSTPATSVTATGSTALKSNYINLNPYLGYRIPFPKVKLDILAGAEIGFITSAREKGSAKTNDGGSANTDTDRKTISKDFRLRAGLAASISRFSLTASYAHGLRNYMSGYIGGGTHEAYSEVIRIGVGYKVF